MAIVVTMQSYVSKRTPKNIRGMIYAVIGCMGAFGCILYLQLYKQKSMAWSHMGFIDKQTIVSQIK